MKGPSAYMKQYDVPWGAYRKEKMHTGSSMIGPIALSMCTCTSDFQFSEVLG